MTVLITGKPKRLFAFGCSFTKYQWGTMWPEIIAYDLDIPHYNYGRSGAGNQYMANVMMQADEHYSFNEDDLVIVCWTNVCRFDNIVEGKWTTPGNLFSQEVYPKNFVRDFVDPDGMLLRDLATIKLVSTFLEQRKVQHHFLSMVDIVKNTNQWSTDRHDTKLSKGVFEPTIKKINNSFYEILWNNDIKKKFEKDRKINPNFKDGHPFPLESLEYLQQIFLGHKFNDTTVQKVNEINNKMMNVIARTGKWVESKDMTEYTTLIPSQSRMGLM